MRKGQLEGSGREGAWCTQAPRIADGGGGRHSEPLLENAIYPPSLVALVRAFASAVRNPRACCLLVFPPRRRCVESWLLDSHPASLVLHNPALVFYPASIAHGSVGMVAWKAN